MKLILNSLSLLLLMSFTPVQGAFPTASYTTNLEEYCNQRFNYCLQYPSGYFPKMEQSDNGDGIIMHTADEAVDVQVTGSYNVLDWSITDIYYHTFEKEIRGDLNTQVLNSRFDDNYAQINVKSGNRLEYIQIFILDNAYVFVSIRVPANTPELLEQLKETVHFSVST